MKACPENALLLPPSFPHGVEEDGAFEGLKQEEEVEEENGAGERERPFVVVKLEEEQAACSARCSSASSSTTAAEAKMELELSLFAPVESEGDDEDEQQRLHRRSLTDGDSDSAGVPVWRTRGACQRGPAESDVPQRRPRGRARKPKKTGGRRGRPRKNAADRESRMDVILEAEEEEETREQVPPQKRARSTVWDFSPPKVSHTGVWEHFEYFINPDGEVEDDGFPTCKLCQQKVACKRGNTSNMLRHLQDYHSAAYYKAKKMDTMWTEWESSDSEKEMKMEEDPEDPEKEWHSEEEKYKIEMDDDDDDDDDDDADYTDRRYPKSPRQKRPIRSAVWQYFECEDNEASNKDKNPICKVCGWKPSSGSSCNTSNMRYHLQTHHQIVCPVSKPGLSTSLEITLAEGEEELKLYPPKNPRKSGVWKLFGFVMNAQGIVEENGFPICRLCHQVVASKDGNTSNMHSHLQRHHQSVHAELKHIIGSARPEPRVPPDPADIHAPVKHRNSPVWKYFGFLKNSEGLVKDDGFALCKMCLRKVAAKDGTTSNMLNHLRRHHELEYEEVKHCQSNPQSNYEAKRKRKWLPEWKIKFEFAEFDASAEVMYCRICRLFPSLAQDNTLFRGVSGVKLRIRSLQDHALTSAHRNCERAFKACEKHKATPRTFKATGQSEAIAHTLKVTEQSGASMHSFKAHEQFETTPHTFKVTEQSEATLHKFKTCEEQATPYVSVVEKMDRSIYDKMEKLFNIAYFIAKDEVPFTMFPKLIDLHHKNGLDLGNTYKNDEACRKFISIIGNSMVEDFTEEIRQSRFFYIMSDSFVNRSVLDQEMIYITYVKDGLQVNRFVRLVKLEHNNAQGYFNAILTGLKTFGLSQEDLITRLVGFGCGGASEMTGIHNEVATKLKDQCPSLITIQSAFNCLELAALDCIKAQPLLIELKEALNGISKHYTKSAKATQELRSIGEAMDINLVKPGNTIRTRWLPHISRALEALLQNYPAIMVHLQATLPIKGKSKQNHSCLKEYKMVLFIHLLLDILQELKVLTLMFQRDDLTLPMVLDGLQRLTITMMAMQLANDSLPLGSVEDGNDLPELFPPTGLPLSPVWDYFGYPKNADGLIEENDHPRCKACRRAIISRQGILSNMLRHLKFHHNSLFAELKLKTGGPRQYKERMRPPPIQASAEELHPPKIALRSAVWKHFGYLKNSEGIVVPDGFPVCKLCLRKVSTQRGSTTNMMVHLQNYHQAEFAEMKLANEENDPNNEGEIPGQAEDRSKLYPPRDILEPVWEHFGYPKDAEDNVQVDGHPMCKLCGSKVSCEGDNTQFLYRHLWKKHKSVYYEVKVATNSLREEDGVAPPDLYPPTQRVKSVVWEYFGYLKDANGMVVCDGFPICKICQLNVAAKGGNTTNMFKHLQDHHKSIYEEIRPSFSDDMVAGVGPSSASSENSASSSQMHSKLWHYFEYPKNAEGTSTEQGAPVCRVCNQTMETGGEITSNLMKHLQENHELVYADVQASVVPSQTESRVEASDLHPPTQSLLSRVWEYFGFLKDTAGAVVYDGYPICRLCQQRVEAKGGDTTNMFLHLKAHHLHIYKEIKPAAERKVYKASELAPPSGEIDSRLWDHFGYPKNADGVVEDDGAPVCKICLQKLISVSKSGSISSNMMRHLRKKHEVVYNEVQEAITVLRAEGGNDLSELHPPTQNVTSPVWEYFGYLKDTEGLVVSDGFPICKMCQKKVASKGGNTTNMFKHLKDYHRTIYDEIRSAVTNETLEENYTAADLHPPSGQYDSTLWEHFGYRKDSEGALQEDGAPFCKHCIRKLVSKGETTRNMRQHLKENHSDIYTEPEEVVSSFTWEADMDSSSLCPPTHKVKSAVWKFFGYPRDPEGSVVCNGFPICKLCQKKVSAKGGNTTNMFSHLRDYHRPTYDEIKAVVIPARPENEVEPLELHLPSAEAMSPVWKYFGYPKNADGSIVCDGFPVCRICQKKVLAKGDNTTNMLIHLRAYHLDIYKEVKSAVAKKVVYRPFELFPPNSQNDIKLWDHFGYPKNEEGVIQDDGAPICKICLRKLMKASGDGTPTTNMLRHLRKKHQSVFDEVQEAITALRTEWGIEPPELHPPTQNVTSPVWEYFGYLKDAEGMVVCDDYPICKLCQQKVASKGRCTTNMFKHLKDYHRPTYDEIRSAVTNESFEDVCLPTDLYPPSGQYNPKLWEHFGYRKSPEGIVEEDGAPICKLCVRKLVSKGETTANMMQHLKENHNLVYNEVQREVNPFTIGGATELPDLHPPEHRVRSAVWKYFGYLRDTEGPADCAGYPICKICLSKVSNKGKVTANMTAHLKEHHRAFYDDLKIPEKREKVVSAEDLPELFPPNKRPIPPIWEYFGLPKNEDGDVEENGCPICKICGRKVSSQDGRRMIRHLQFCHFSMYEEFKDNNERSPSNEEPRFPVQSELAVEIVGTWAPVPHTVPYVANVISPLARMKPPVFPSVPDLERTQSGERQDLLLEVLNHCKMLHTVVQRLEKKIDNLQSNQCTNGGCRTQEGHFETGQLSSSLAQRLGPSPQTSYRWNPPWKHRPASQSPDITDPLQSDQCSFRNNTGARGGGGKAKRRGRWGGTRRRFQKQSDTEKLQSELEPPMEEALPIKEEFQPTKVWKKAPHPNKLMKNLKKQMKHSVCVGGAKTEPKDEVPVKLEDKFSAEEDKQVMIGSASRNVWIPVSVYMHVFKEAEPQKAVVPVLYALFPVSTLSCSAITSDPLRGIQQLEPNKLEALREWLAEMYPQHDMRVRGKDWAQCLGVINRITKNLCRRKEISGYLESTHPELLPF